MNGCLLFQADLKWHNELLQTGSFWYMQHEGSRIASISFDDFFVVHGDKFYSTERQKQIKTRDVMNQ